MKISANILVLVFVAVLALVLQMNGIRICPVYHFFHIPCPGCGCTRALISLIKGDIAMSWNYNPLVILGIICGLICLSFYKKIDRWMKAHLLLTFMIAAIAAVLLEIHNLHNPLLW